jgi:N utilization substance protein A
MNNELIAMLDFMERDRGLDREVIAKAIEEAVHSAARKAFGPNEIEVNLDVKTGDMVAFAKLTVVEEVEDDAIEIAFSEAKSQHPDCKVGDEIEWHIPTEELGRIVAQSAKQGIFQRLREVEKDQARLEFLDRIGDILYGIVARFNKGQVIVNFDGFEGELGRDDRIVSERYQVGDHICCILKDVNTDRTGPVLIVSRIDNRLVESLFEREVSEIGEGIVLIKAVSRAPGYRSKIAVSSNDPRVDPVGACVGIRGTRVKTIVRELNGEKVDIVPFHEDPVKFIGQALQPAQIISIKIDQDTRRASVLVEEDQLSLAIGRRGQNVTLASELTGWQIDIDKEASEVVDTIEDKLTAIVQKMSEALEVDLDVARKLADHGYLSIEGLKAAELTDLTEIDGIDDELAEKIIQVAQ